MKRLAAAIRGARYGWVALHVLLTARCLIIGQWLAALVWAAFGALHARSLRNDERKDQRHGHRQPRRGHRDHRPGTRGADTGDDGAGGAGAVPLVLTFTPGAGARLNLTVQPAHPGPKVAPGSAWYASNGSAWSGRPIRRRQSEDTIRAWKRSAVDLDDGRPVLIGPISRRYLAVDDGVAQCFPMSFSPHATAVLSEHWGEAAPKVDCTCGFYAVDDLSDLIDHPLVPGVASLEVELYGRVIRHQRGYRAGRQRVLAVNLDPTCNHCHDDTPAELVAVGYRAEPGSMVYAILGAPFATWAACLCGRCADDHAPNLISTWTPPALAQELGTEVRWAAAA
jgi:hypothetical protein